MNEINESTTLIVSTPNTRGGTIIIRGIKARLEPGETLPPYFDMKKVKCRVVKDNK